MLKFDNKLLAQCYYWFGITCVIFGIATQYSNRTLLVPQSFYILVGIFSMMAGIFVALKDKK